jgi:predicted RND superfamily exporter protein
LWESVFEKTTSVFLRHRKTVLLVFLFFASTHVFFLLQLRIDFRPSSLFQEHNKELDASRTYQACWQDDFQGIYLVVSVKYGRFNEP